MADSVAVDRRHWSADITLAPRHQRRRNGRYALAVAPRPDRLRPRRHASANRPRVNLFRAWYKVRIRRRKRPRRRQRILRITTRSLAGSVLLRKSPTSPAETGGA